MSTTPRTDAAKEQYLTGKMGIYGVLDEARTLENELASMSIISGRWEADALRYVKNAEYWQSRAEKAEAELAKRDAEYLRGAKMVAESASVWQSRAEKAEAALQKIKDVMREDSNGKDPMDAVEDIITAAMEETGK
jgi:hypothetical protein